MGYGDFLMALGEARSVHAASGSRVVMAEGTHADYASFLAGHPYAVLPGASNAGAGLPVIDTRGRRPYIDYEHITAKRVRWKPYQPAPAELVFSASQQASIAALRARLAPFVLVEPNIKDAKLLAENKDWGIRKYQQVVDALGVRCVQPRYGRKLLDGVVQVDTPKFLDAVLLLAAADAALLPEGGLHHAAAAVGTPAVVIYGGVISPANTGYDLHLNQYAGGEPCGSRKPCRHCRQAMGAIGVPRVVADLRRLLAARGVACAT
jgi:hypothetical protein